MRPTRRLVTALALAVSAALALGAPSSHADGKKPVIRFIAKFTTIQWPPKIRDEIMKIAADDGIDYQITGPQNGDVAQQVNLIEDAISDKVDGLVVSSLGPSTCQAINEAVDAGIKVVTADSDCPDSKRISFVGANDIRLGADAATLFARGSAGKGPQRILIVTGTPGAQNLQNREKGFKDKLAALGVQAEYLPTVPCYEDIQKAVDAIESALRSDPKITGIYVTAFWPFQADAKNFPLMTKAVKEGRMTVVNVDALSGSLKLVEDGYVYGEAAQNLGQSNLAPFELAYQVAIKGVKYPKVCNIASQLVTKDGGDGTIAAAEFEKKYWVDLDWDLHPLSPEDCLK